MTNSEIIVDIRPLHLNHGWKRLCYLQSMNISGVEHAPKNFINEIKPRSVVLSFSEVNLWISFDENGKCISTEKWPKAQPLGY